MNRPFQFARFTPLSRTTLIVNPVAVQYLNRLAAGVWNDKGGLSALFGMVSDILNANQLHPELRVPFANLLTAWRTRIEQLPNVPGERYDW